MPIKNDSLEATLEQLKISDQALDVKIANFKEKLPPDLKEEFEAIMQEQKEILDAGKLLVDEIISQSTEKADCVLEEIRRTVSEGMGAINQKINTMKTELEADKNIPLDGTLNLISKN